MKLLLGLVGKLKKALPLSIKCLLTLVFFTEWLPAALI